MHVNNAIWLVNSVQDLDKTNAFLVKILISYNNKTFTIIHIIIKKDHVLQCATIIIFQIIKIKIKFVNNAWTSLILDAILVAIITNISYIIIWLVCVNVVKATIRSSMEYNKFVWVNNIFIIFFIFFYQSVAYNA